MTKEEYEAIIDEKLKAVKQELMSEYKEEEPSIDGWKEGDTYFYRNSLGIVCEGMIETTDDGKIDGVDIARITHGYAKHTEEEVQFQIERDAVLYELSKYAEPKDAVWDMETKHYYIYYRFIYNKVSVDYSWKVKSNNIYFASRKDAEKAIKEVGEERVKKYYLGVEE